MQPPTSLPAPGISRTRERIGGAILALLGIGFTVWRWTTVHQSYPNVKAEVVFPTFAVLGLAMLFVPGYRQERLARGEDISALRGARLITPRWWAILAIGAGAGLVNLTGYMAVSGRSPF